MDHVSSVLQSVLRKRGLHANATAARGTHEAREWLQKKEGPLKDAVTVKNVKDGVLLLECEHPVALQEMQAASGDLLRYLQGVTPGLVKQIRVARR